jgi:hypothetical protein
VTWFACSKSKPEFGFAKTKNPQTATYVGTIVIFFDLICQAETGWIIFIIPLD